MEFISSDPDTIGVELELQLLDPDTLDLFDGIMPLLEFYPRGRFVKPELIQNTVEINTGICRSADELYRDLHGIARDVKRRCIELNMDLCASGTHPFSQKLAMITPQPRYKRMEVNNGIQSRIQTTYATHVHIGMQSGQQTIEVMERLRPFIPLLIALSANSPYWHGQDTGYVCYRQRILAAARTYGIPPAFGSWEQFLGFMSLAERTAMFKSEKDIHWDLRPRPTLGTIEVRCMDAQSSITDSIALAAFVRALVCFLKESPAEVPGEAALPQALDWWLEKENHFRASRKGLEAYCICNKKGVSRQLMDIWQQVFVLVYPVGERLGDGNWLQRFRQGIDHGPGYSRQLRYYQNYQSFPEVVSRLANELQQELAL